MTHEIKQRGRFAAAALALLAPGLGQLYIGRPRRAAAFFAISLVLYAALNAIASSTAIWSATTFIVGAILAASAFCFSLFVIADAYRGAARLRQLELRRYNRWYVYLAVILATAGLFTAVDFTPIDAHAYKIPSSSMVPTLIPGDRILVSSAAYRTDPPDRGDVVVHMLADPSRGTYVKRLVGLPGDRIQIRDGVLHINDVPVARELLEDQTQPPSRSSRSAGPGTLYLETIADGQPHRIIEHRDTGHFDNTRVFDVPPGHYFTIGDNRDNSTDSRMPMVGFIPHDNLRGRVLYVYWADDWSRIGTLVR